MITLNGGLNSSGRPEKTALAVWSDGCTAGTIVHTNSLSLSTSSEYPVSNSKFSATFPSFLAFLMVFNSDFDFSELSSINLTLYLTAQTSLPAIRTPMPVSVYSLQQKNQKQNPNC